MARRADRSVNRKTGSAAARQQRGGAVRPPTRVPEPPSIAVDRKPSRAAWLALVARLAVGAIFVLAGVTKLLTLGTFTATLLAYDVLPVSLLRPLALILPWIEVAVGLYLLAGLFTRAAAWGATGLLAVFMLAIAQAVLRGLSLQDCGCFGSITAAVPALQYVLGGSSLGPADLLRDAVYVALALFVALGPQAPLSADALLARRQSAA